MDIEEIFESSALFTNSLLTSEPNLQSNIIYKYLDDRLSNKNKMSHDFVPGLDWININKSLSFQKELQGKLVVLDFFTYCCINCMHILPQLKSLENKFSVEDGLVVIGVHSPKFANEHSTENVRAAVKRYEISHPVVNDHGEHLWNSLGICCWPTLVIIGPGGELLLYLMGESHEQLLHSFVKEALVNLKEKNAISHHSIPGMGVEHERVERLHQLYFPGKVCAIETPEGLQLAVSDTGNHRVIILDNDGLVQWIIGGTQSGFEDGDFQMAKFHSPQGLAFLDPSTLFVADTENHALRRVDLKTSQVSTLAGDGRQGEDLVGGGQGVSQRLSSPWDLLFMSDSILIVAMAGSHQLWAYFIDDTTFWKNKRHLAGSCAAIVGSGREENRNNAYPQSAGLAQPSGLSLGAAGQLFVADSESSTVRVVSMADGRVSALVGGMADPQNLFAFGDKDGCGVEARLQHPLAVAWSTHKSRLYVCDSYNHKIKIVDPSSRHCSTLKFSNSVDSLNEPGGLCSVDNLLYVADTNNHCIKIINLDDNTMKMMSIKFQPVKTSKVRHSEPVSQVETSINSTGGVVKLSVSLQIPPDVKLLEESPVMWTLALPDGWKELDTSEGGLDRHWTLEVAGCSDSDGRSNELRPQCRLLYCHEGLCSKRDLTFRIIVQFKDTASNQATCHVQHHLSLGKS